MLYESIAETSEELMEKFFAGETITYNEAINAVHDGSIHGGIAGLLRLRDEDVGRHRGA